MSEELRSPHDLSIGGWCLQHPGHDPFGDAVRKFSLEDVLKVLGDSPIRKVSFHDRDLWPDDASAAEVEDKIGQVKGLLEENGLEILNFTINMFSHPAFRSGAFSSPFPEVVEAAFGKAIRGMEAANLFGAKDIIWWPGREGDDGAYATGPGMGLNRYMTSLKALVAYGLEMRYTFGHTIEPKQYEPRLSALHIGSGAVAAMAIMHYFPETSLRDKIRINPEYPQHTMMLGLPPVMELQQLLEVGLLANFIHFGGQVPGRMDCDLPPGYGSSFYDDFMVCLSLHESFWGGIVEFDCRPDRNTTTLKGLADFLNGAAEYWRTLESKVVLYFHDEQIRILNDELDRPLTPKVQTVHHQTRSLASHFGETMPRFLKGGISLDEAAAVETDAIGRYQRRVRQIIMSPS